jgi:hypothetical protein
MSVATYLWGAVVLGGTLGLLAGGSNAVARTAFPRWYGPVGVLARIALALCWVYAVSYLLGAVGWFRPLPLFGLIDGGAAAAWLVTRRRSAPPELAPEDGGQLPSSGASSLGLRWLAALGTALVVGAWLPGTAHAYRYGILEPDSLWYHGHFSARFVQTGWLTRINPVGVDALVPFHLANRELLDAVLALPWHRDLALPLTNLVYLGLLLLAGWCIGARWDRGPLALLAAATIASAPVMILSHPGSLKNDLFAAALLLAAVALLIHSDGRLPEVALAGATLGLTAGTKSNVLVVVVALLGFGALALLRRTGWVAPVVWVAATVAFGAYWYLRNWVRAGNPLPWIEIDLGPLHLSQVEPADGSEGYSSQTLVEHFDHPDLVDNVVYPGLRGAFGNLWWAWGGLLVVSFGLVAASFRRRMWVLWALAGAGLLGLAAHLVTPLSLVVSPDNPAAAFNFAFNTRYALPAAALVLVAGACATRSRRAELVFAGATLVVIVSGLFPTGLSAQVSHDGEAADAPLTVAVGLALVALVAWVAWVLIAWPRLGRNRPELRLAAVLVPPLVGVALAFPLVDRYMTQRYATPMPKLASLLWPTTSGLRDARIGIATDPKPYPHAGADLSNRVDYIGLPGHGGVLRNAESCEEWGRAVRSLRLTHVALAPEPFVVVLSGQTMEAWTMAIPGARVVRREGDQVLIELTPDPPPTPPGACPPGA